MKRNGGLLIIEYIRGGVIVMVMYEEKGNLFTLPPEFALVHCISEDCALGAGIAKQFQLQFNLRDRLKNYIKSNNLSYPCTIGCQSNDRLIFNLVTKQNYWDKPIKKDFLLALSRLSFLCEKCGVNKLGMPKIGCGLDQLDWDWVKGAIEETFKNMDIEIRVRFLGRGGC